ncbi:melatonin receptor type 1C-like [Dreissena polymorpha]|uniref:melatonin receptor type 1C-like n=1 Tax=Dreissena polymorpha TaxID=45954 RepID=UPI002263C451|nr:melatonin receptor type 1C-like [Dreissena polymorpha]
MYRHQNRQILVTSVQNETDVFTQNISPNMRNLFDINFNLGVAYVFIVSVLCCVGTTGNSAILYVMKKEPQFNGHARVMMINMAIADLCVTAIADPMCIIGAFTGMRIMHWGRWLCITVASLCLTTCVCVFLNIVNITVNRWLFICYTNVYSKIYNQGSTIGICILSWILGFGAEFPNYVGWGDHTFDEKSHQCYWDRTADHSYTVFVTAGLLTAAMFPVIFCNMAMVKKIWDVKRNVQSFQNSYTKSVMSTVSSVKILVTMMVVALVCWLPYVTLLVSDHDNTASMETHLLLSLLAHSHSTWTPVIYFAFKKNFRDHIRRLFNRTNLVHPTSSNVGSNASKAKRGTSKDGFNRQQLPASQHSSSIEKSNSIMKSFSTTNTISYTLSTTSTSSDKPVPNIHDYPVKASHTILEPIQENTVSLTQQQTTEFSTKCTVSNISSLTSCVTVNTATMLSAQPMVSLSARTTEEHINASTQCTPESKILNNNELHNETQSLAKKELIDVVHSENGKESTTCIVAPKIITTRVAEVSVSMGVCRPRSGWGLRTQNALGDQKQTSAFLAVPNSDAFLRQSTNLADVCMSKSKC